MTRKSQYDEGVVEEVVEECTTEEQAAKDCAALRAKYKEHISAIATGTKMLIDSGFTPDRAATAALAAWEQCCKKE